MYGKVIVGDGGVTVIDNDGDADAKEDKSDSNTPGFVSVTAVIALLGALLFARNRKE
jgi:PGF-CTERM protein